MARARIVLFGGASGGSPEVFGVREREMVSRMELNGRDYTAVFDKARGKMLGLRTREREIEMADKGVSLIYNGRSYSTLDREPAQIDWRSDSFTKVYVFSDFEMTVTTAVSGNGGALVRTIGVTPNSGAQCELQSRRFLELEFAVADMEVVRHAMWASSLTAVFCRTGSDGLIAVFDHPFGIAEVDGSRVRLRENTCARVSTGDTFVEGRLYFGPTQLTGTRISQAPIDELDYAYHNSWQPFARRGVGKSWRVRGEEDLDEGEIAAPRELVESMLPWEKREVVSCHVPWCENDYEIDVNTDEGFETYARMLDLLNEIGCRYTLFTPGMHPYPKRPDGGWQHVMWVGLGAVVADREWTPDTPLPPNVRKLLDMAEEKGIGVLAYVNPAYRFGADKEYWLRMNKDGTRQDECCYACKEFRDWLTRTLVEFKNAYGLAGYCFDFIGEHHPCHDPDHDHAPGEDTHLVGWRAFQSITRALNDADPDILIDGRLCTYRFAPFAASGITYPHPFLDDEQPNHMTAWPDLSLDRVFANFLRRVAYWARNRFFLPNYKIPGFITHQQSRTFRWKHSWDRLGWKYSVLSSIAAAGINNVINYLPVRELDEYESFTAEDRAWLGKWLKWAEENADLLLNTRNINGEPRPEMVDGTAACVGDRGVVFLVNPNYRGKHVQVDIGERIGLTDPGPWLVTELHPNEGAVLGEVRFGEALQIGVPPHEVLVMQLEPGTGKPFKGRCQDWMEASVEGWRLEDGSKVSFPYEFGQAPGWQVDAVDVATKPTHWVKFTCDWTPDPRIREKLYAQRTPLKLENHERVQPYLDPGRLLMSFMFRFAENIVQAEMKVNGQRVPVETCYLGSSWRAVEDGYRERNICGLYADLDGLIGFGESHRIELEFAHYGPCEWTGAYIEHL